MATGWLASVRADHVHQARLADAGCAGNQELERLVGRGTEALGFPHQHLGHLACLPHEVGCTGRDEAGGRDGWLLTRHAQSPSLWQLE